MNTCVYCGNRFTGKPKNAKYCQPLCARRAYSKTRRADGRHKAYKRTERAKEARRRYLSGYVEQRACEQCASPFSTRKDRPTRTCSPPCALILIHGYPCSEVPWHHPSRSTRVPEDHLARQGRCTRCTAHFTINSAGQRYCSTRCRERAAGARRDARMRGAFVSEVSPHEVYERDQWTCHLCAEPLDRDAQVPHPLAPTIDHVIPLARHGTHEPSNVKAAHFLCNATKRDQIDFAMKGKIR